MNNPFKEFYRVWTAKELINFAFSKASSKSPAISKTLPHLEKIKKKEIKRIQNSVNILIDKLEKIVKSVPNLDELPLFYQQLSHLLVNNDDLRKALGRLNGIIPILKRLEKEHRRKIGTSINSKQAGLRRMEFFGRCTSIINKQKETLIFLEECRLKLEEVPPINLAFPCVVIAGYPNVGKSTIVGNLSSAKPQVSEYPFTTKQIYIGTYKDQFGGSYFQVIDTPGVLDRPMYERNNIEKQAILALRTIATIIMFVFDPTLGSGYDVDSQVALFQEIRENFAKDMQIPLKVIVNKIDYATSEEIETLAEKLGMSTTEMLLMSAKTGENVEQVKKFLLDYFHSTNYQR